MTFRIAKKDRLLVTSVDELANHTFVSLGNDIGALDPLVNLIYKEWDLNKSLITDDKLGLFRVVAKCAVISMLPCYQKLDFISSKTNYNAIKKLRFGISRILRRIRYSYTCVIDLALWTNARLLMLSWPTTQLFSDWKRRLDEFGINIRTYTRILSESEWCLHHASTNKSALLHWSNIMHAGGSIQIQSQKNETSFQQQVR